MAAPNTSLTWVIGATGSQQSTRPAQGELVLAAVVLLGAVVLVLVVLVLVVVLVVLVLVVLMVVLVVLVLVVLVAGVDVVVVVAPEPVWAWASPGTRTARRTASTAPRAVRLEAPGRLASKDGDALMTRP